MSVPTISSVKALEILDSRGRPTVKVTLSLADGTRAEWCPPGASTGSREAVELRDHETARYHGLGVLKAVNNVTGPIADLVRGRSASRASRISTGSSSSSTGRRIGAGPMDPRSRTALAGGRSRRSARQGALRVPARCHGSAPAAAGALFQRAQRRRARSEPAGLPGVHDQPARCEVDVRGGACGRRDLRHPAHPAQAGRASGRPGRRGRLRPRPAWPEQALEALVAAIDGAGYALGPGGVAIAMDPASSEFRQDDGSYLVNGTHFSDEMIERYVHIADNFPVWLLEDGLAENDWGGWRSSPPP